MNIPKFEIVKKELLALIHKMPEDQIYLPYESELEKMFKVSKRTVRRALLDLREDGLIDTGRKRGSRVLRNQDVSAERGVQNLSGKFLEGSCIASVFIGDQAGRERTAFLPWRITGELEIKAARAGGRFMIYNLREEKWRNVEDVVKSMKDNRVEWFFCFLHEKIMDRLPLRLLMKNQIKPLMYVQDLEQVHVSAHMLGDGVDFIATNHSSGIYDSLCRCFSDVDFIAYIGGAVDISWEQARIDVIRRFADQNNIPLEVSIGLPAGSIRHDNDERGQYYVEQDARTKSAYDATVKLIKKIKKSRRPLLIGANDVYARGIIQCLEERGISFPGEVEVLGYDNSNLAMQDNLSSFYQAQKKITDSAFEFCRIFYADKGNIMRHSNAKIFAPLLFKRASTR
ncbi:MAG: substrate-binding domain-containing protein [Victivallales bacterium]|jgi:DNA-binding LacI/PurR family transcriptional regulator